MDEHRDRLRDEMAGEHAPADGHDRVIERIHRRERRRRLIAGGIGLSLTVLLVLGLAELRGGNADRPAASVSVTPAPSSPTPTLSPTPADPGLPEAPPPVTVRFFDQSVELFPGSYCYRSGCVDGGAGQMPDVGAPDHVTIEFPLEGWSFTAHFTPWGDNCGREQSTPLTPTGDGIFTLKPIGFAGDYVVSLFGDARKGGSLSVAFRWTTPSDGPLPEPRAYLALLSNNDPVTSYGLELSVTNLASTPTLERAIITVRASNGREITFEGEPADRDCLPEGTVYWDEPDAKGRAAAALGDPPFTYEVELILDGRHYMAAATWPNDEIKGEEPAVLLHFAPALPALAGS